MHTAYRNAQAIKRPSELNAPMLGFNLAIVWKVCSGIEDGVGYARSIMCTSDCVIGFNVMPSGGLKNQFTRNNNNILAYKITYSVQFNQYCSWLFALTWFQCSGLLFWVNGTTCHFYTQFLHFSNLWPLVQLANYFPAEVRSEVLLKNRPSQVISQYVRGNFPNYLRKLYLHSSRNEMSWEYNEFLLWIYIYITSCDFQIARKVPSLQSPFKL